MTVLLNPAMTKIYLGGSAKERVYCCDIPHEDTIQVLNYSYRTLQQIFWGFENLNLFFGRHSSTPPPCWVKGRNYV